MSEDTRHATLAEAMARLDQETLFATVMRQPGVEVEIYAPQGTDRQTPHTRDELYVVMRGAGWFVNGAERHPFGPGDVLYVPAGVEHRFEEFSEDFATWVVFVGPEGGADQA
jgi:mannose-6-phosphate isomerase-like protein (cupin superfamily)